MRTTGLKELNVTYVSNIIIHGKVFQISKRELRKDTKYYLHLPLRKVTKEDEISKTLTILLLRAKRNEL